MKSFPVVLVLTSCFCLLWPAFGLAQKSKAEKKEAQRARRAARSLSLLAANGGGGMLRSDIEMVSANPQLLDWVKLNKAALIDAGANPFTTPTRWGVATTKGNSLYLHLTSWPKSGKLLFPRLHNSVLSTKFTDQERPLKLTPNVGQWEIALPEKRQRDSFPAIIELQLDRPVQVGEKNPPIVKPAEDNVIYLHARYGVTHGQMLRFEPQPHKNTIGYWTKEDDWVEWACEADKDKTYDVHMRYGCGKGQGGSEIEIEINEHTIPYVVEVTGGFQAWKDVRLGEVKGLDGITNVRVKAKEKAKAAVMDIQEIKLIPQPTSP